MAEENENMASPFGDETLLARWLSGELSTQERKQVEEHPHFADWQRIAEASNQWEAPDYQAEEAWNKLQSATKNNQVSIREVKGRRIFLGMAASLALIILAYFLLQPSETIYETGIGDQVVQSLPDGSVVKLNAVSQLDFSPKQWSKQRTVHLTGEAFFDVEPGSTFIVQTDAGKIVVLGTEFNVFARKEGFSVSCFEGRVQVTTANGASEELTAGEYTILSSEGLQKRGHGSISSPGWVEGETRFRSAELPFVFLAFERQFGVSISYDKLPNKAYSG
ncbi:MAG: FecR domain-containing protein, partial [Bacteroidota bacterium]